MPTNVNNIKALPLFMGLSMKELKEIAECVSFKMRHVKKGSIILEAESKAEMLHFICQGWFDIETISDDRSYSFIEIMQALYTVEPDKLFGLHQRYRSTYVAQTPCEIISLSKDTISDLVCHYFIVRLNFLNMICRKSQQQEHSIWRATNDDLKQRITQFIRQRCLYPAGKKVLHITMNQLAKELNDSRLNVSIALNELADSERLIIKRGIIEVPALQLL